MLAAWNAVDRQLVPEGLASARWLHAVAPTPAEQQLLVAQGVPAGLLQHVLDENEVARVDHVDGTSLVVIRVPRAAPRPDEPYRTAALGIIVVGDRVVTVAPVEGDLLPHLGLPHIDGEGSIRFVLRLLERVAAAYLNDLRTIDRAVEETEARLQDAQENIEVKALLCHQKGLAHFETALRSNQIMLERLRRDTRFKRSQDDDELFDDVEVELRQAAEMTAISTNILSSTMDAFASIISNNLNVVMKRLTALTLLISIPTVVASFYGMNVALPLAEHPLAFVLTALGSVVAAVGVGIAFRGRRWL